MQPTTLANQEDAKKYTEIILRSKQVSEAA